MGEDASSMRRVREVSTEREGREQEKLDLLSAHRLNNCKLTAKDLTIARTVHLEFLQVVLISASGISAKICYF